MKLVKKKRTVVLGASPNPTRYSNLATLELISHGVEVYPVGIRKGTIGSLEILLGQPDIKDVHTITLYMGAIRQQDVINYMLELCPQRVIFNPGAENPDFERQLVNKGIEVLNACTLVMLSTGQY